MTRCGRPTKDGTPCRHPAGLRTNHPGQGACYLHGGCGGRLKHGQRSKYVKALWRKIGEAHRDDPATYDPDEQIALQIGILNRHVEDCLNLEQRDERNKLSAEDQERMADLRQELFMLSSIITKSLERRARMQAAIEERPPMKVVVQLFSYVFEVLNTHVRDERIKDAIFAALERLPTAIIERVGEVSPEIPAGNSL